jgi:hypothetical protein
VKSSRRTPQGAENVRQVAEKNCDTSLIDIRIPALLSSRLSVRSELACCKDGLGAVTRK